MDKNIAILSAFTAITTGDVERLDAAVSSGLGVNEQFDGRLLLVKAATAGLPLIECLLKAGADVNAVDASGNTPLLAAIDHGQRDVVRVLLQKGANANFAPRSATPLAKCARKRTGGATPLVQRNMEIAELLLRAGADVNQVIRSLDGRPTSTALIAAARAGNRSMVEFLLKHGAHVNEQVVLGTALTAAAEEGETEIANLLLEAGADPSLRVADDPRMQELRGKTALDIAKMKRKKAVVELLESQGGPAASPTPLSLAAAWQLLIARLGEVRPEVVKTIRPPASKTNLADLEETIGRPLAPKLREWFGLHDGQMATDDAEFIDSDDELSLGFRLLGAAEAASEWRAWMDIAREREPAARRRVASATDAAFRAEWLPLSTDGGGDSHCLNLGSGKGKGSGEVVMVCHDERSRPRVASDLAEWIKDLADAI